MVFKTIAHYQAYFVIAVLVIFLAGCTMQNSPGQPSSVSNSSQQQQSQNNSVPTQLISQGPTFICNIFDNKSKALGIGGADLGVPILSGTKQWLVFGDSFANGAVSLHGPSGPAGSSSVIESDQPFNCSISSWVENSDGTYYQPLISKRIDKVDASTVPAGAVSVNGTIYLYSMRVEHWSNDNNPLPTPAYGVLFKQQNNSPFIQVASWATDQPHVNTAPVDGALPNGTKVIYMALSGIYRDSPIDLAYVLPSDIENVSRYHYFTGYDQNGLPIWSSDISMAKPVPGFENVLAGELSFIYDEPLNTYLIMFNNYQTPYAGFVLASSNTPYGPYTTQQTFFPCGSEGSNTRINKPAWMQPGWGGCYGGYMIPNDFGPDGHDLYFTLSLWNPYATMLMKMRLNSNASTN